MIRQSNQLPLLTWFTNSHEHSLHYLKFGLMQLARAGEIRLQERPTESADDWLPAKLRQRHYRRIVLVGLEWQGQRRLIAVDGEDSPFQLSDIINQVDRYYTCTYCPHLYQEREFKLALPWQDESEIKPYHAQFEQLVERYGEQFSKVRPWAPIGPELESPRSEQNWFRRKTGNARHKLQMQFNGTHDWRPQYERFSERWSYIQSLRSTPPTADVVLLDSLWGWPRHRIGLHQELASLEKRGYTIRSRLNYRKPEAYELGHNPAPNPDEYPMQVGEPIQGEYERLLAGSKLGVFATGFHYGWRNIVTLAWALGLRTVQDPFTYIFLFDTKPFYCPLGPAGWNGLAPLLDQARLETLDNRRSRWCLFDEVASPGHLATKIVDQLKFELF